MDKKNFVKILGSLFVFSAVCFLLFKLWQSRHAVLEWQLSPHLILYLILGCVLYACICSLLASAWYKLIIYFGQEEVSFTSCYGIYARTQIARYLPGNVFHLPGRHIAGRSLGFENAPLVGATLYEIIGILASLTTLALFCYVVFDVATQSLSISKLSLILSFSIIFIIIFTKFTPHLPLFREIKTRNTKATQVIRDLAPIFLMYFIFFILLGGIFLSVVHIVTEVSGIGQLGQIMTVFAMAVIAGFITPGAPGGLGVREAIIVGFLSGTIGNALSLFIALLFRIITLVGDLLFFLSSFAWGKHPRKSIELPDYDRE